MPFTIETCTAQHIGDRDEQQDRVGLFTHLVQKGALLAVLADGMGGHSGGAMAAEQVIHSARNVFLASAPGGGDVEAMLAEGINDAHDGINLSRFTTEQDPHSTACLLILQPGRADWAHCGDSRLYHFRAGLMVSCTQDHSHVMNLVKMGYLTPEQAESHPQKNLLISCLGDTAPPQIDFGGSAPLVGGDCFLLCSDGLWTYFSDDELGQVLHEYPVREAAEILINTARSRAEGRGDNCTLAIVRLKETEPEKPLPLWKKPAANFHDA